MKGLNGVSMTNSLIYTTGTGIVYKEEYPMVTAKTVGKTSIVYKKLDIESKEETIYNSEYDLSRRGVISEIVEDNISPIWQSGYCTSTPVFKKEYMEGISSDVIIDVNTSLNRGGVSAMESHFKLSECNCLEDLENYQNNFFNI